MAEDGLWPLHSQTTMVLAGDFGSNQEPQDPKLPILRENGKSVVLQDLFIDGPPDSAYRKEIIGQSEQNRVIMVRAAPATGKPQVMMMRVPTDAPKASKVKMMQAPATAVPQVKIDRKSTR